jgi:hypothetical protein
MIKTTPIIIVALTALTLIGCGSRKNAYQPIKVKPIPEAKVEAGNEASLYPLNKGNEWVYSLTSSQVVGKKEGHGTSEVTFRVTNSQTIGDVTKATIDIYNKQDVPIDRQIWQVDKTGIYQVSSGLKNLMFTPPQATAVFPIKKEAIFKWKGSCPSPFGTIVTGEWQSANNGVEEVDTPANRYSAYVFDSVGKLVLPKGLARQSSRVWFVPNIGMVRTSVVVETKTGSVSMLLKLISSKVKL